MSDDPHIVVTESDGTTVTSVLLDRRIPIRENPITGFGQVVTAGDGAQRTDQRTPQVIVTDQPQGMGLRHYTETEGLDSYTISDCDTRFPGIVCLPPKRTQLGSQGTINGFATFVEYVGIAGSYILKWAWRDASANSAYRYNDGAGTWHRLENAGTGISNLTGYAAWKGLYLFATSNSSVGIYHTTDPASWTLGGKAKACYGLCIHDNKAFTFNDTDNTLDWTTDPTVVHASWTQSSELYLNPGELVTWLAEWQRGGRTAVFLVTNRRILWYDEDADTFHEFFDLRGASLTPSGFYPMGLSSRHDGNLYVTLGGAPPGDSADLLYKFSGVVEQIGPNKRGGLPDEAAFSFVNAASGGPWLYLFGQVRANGSGDRVFALNEQGGFSTIWTGAGEGLGYAAGKLFISSQGQALELPVSGTNDSPLVNAPGYHSDETLYHEYAFTDGGTPNTPKQWQYVVVQSLDHTTDNKVPGLAADTSLVVQIRADTDTAWTTLDTLTSADTFPAVVRINNGRGVSAKQLKVRLGLLSTNANRTPVVTMVALAYLRREVPRFAYSLRADLSWRDHELYAGQDIAQIVAAIRRWNQPGEIVKLQFAGADWTTAPATGITVEFCTVEYSASYDPEQGPMTFDLIFSDVTPPDSG